MMAQPTSVGGATHPAPSPGWTPTRTSGLYSSEGARVRPFQAGYLSDDSCDVDVVCSPPHDLGVGPRVGDDMAASLHREEDDRWVPVLAKVSAVNRRLVRLRDVVKSRRHGLSGDAVPVREIGCRLGSRQAEATRTEAPQARHSSAERDQAIAGAMNQNHRDRDRHLLGRDEIVRDRLSCRDDNGSGEQFRCMMYQANHHLASGGVPETDHSIAVDLARSDELVDDGAGK